MIKWAGLSVLVKSSFFFHQHFEILLGSVLDASFPSQIFSVDERKEQK